MSSWLVSRFCPAKACGIIFPFIVKRRALCHARSCAVFRNRLLAPRPSLTAMFPGTFSRVRGACCRSSAATTRPASLSTGASCILRTPRSRKSSATTTTPRRGRWPTSGCSSTSRYVGRATVCFRWFSAVVFFLRRRVVARFCRLSSERWRRPIRS